MLIIELSKEFDLSGSEIFGDESHVVWLDIETRKIAAPADWHQRTRWQPFMVAVCGAIDPGVFFVEVVSGDEEDIIEYMEQFEGYEIRYTATREFDEMVLRGRFTNARRAHSPYAGSWPNLDKLECTWLNVRKDLLPKETIQRGADVASRDVPYEWDKGNHDIVVVHCERDVVEIVLLEPEVMITPKLRNELKKILV